MAINNYKHNLNEPLQLNDVIASKLDVTGITSTGTLNATSLNVSGVTSTGTLNATSLNVSGVTSTGPLNINGITTIRGSASSGNLQPLQINQTWTAGSGIATALTVNVTDTSSNASSRLLDLRIGGTQSFYVGKSGRFGGNGASFQISNTGGWQTLSLDGGNGLQFSGANSTVLNLGNMNSTGPGLTLFSGNYISWTTTNSTALYGNNPNVLEQRNGTNPQTFRIYNNVTGTGNTNFERAYLGWTSNTFVVGTQTDGTGTARQMEFQTNGTTRVAITTTGLVGIGTTIPLQNLHVLGNLLVAAGSSTGQHITQRAYEVNNGTLSWEGSAGQLFSITNNLTTGSIFAVNDVSGIPSIDVDANGIIQIGPYGGNVGIGTTNPTSKLHVVGNTLVSGVTTTGLLNVGVGGTIITTVGVGSTTFVGIGSTQPGSTLVVNAPSGYSGNLLDLQVNGTRALSFGNSRIDFGTNISVARAGTEIFAADAARFYTRENISIAIGGYNTTVLHGESVNVLAQRRDTNAQTSRIYNTFTSSTNFERGSLGWSNNVFIIGTEKGTAGGTARQLELQTDGTTRVAITTTGDVGIGTTSPTYKLHVVGSFGATTKSFIIPHPTKEGKKLQYGSLESPYHGIRLTGSSTIQNGMCVVELPEYIHNLVKEEGINIHITNIKHGKVIWVEEVNVSENNFVVMMEEKTGEYDFYWDFTAIRKDVEDLKVEF
jgi:hypothetical protein